MISENHSFCIETRTQYFATFQLLLRLRELTEIAQCHA